jgi:ABC-2 type transport system ATP-binding protein
VAVKDVNGHTELQLILEKEEVLSGVLSHLNARGSGLIALEKQEPSLEDVFINMVGRSLSEDTSKRGGGENE